VIARSIAAPFATLDPPSVLAAAESVGIVPSGRLFALNSYENRVYQLAAETGELWVLKFYRAARWTDAQIREEHAFALELAARDLPVAPPIVRDGASLFAHDGHRFALFPYVAGRAPELDSNAALELLGRTLARMHTVGAAQVFRARPRLSIARFGSDARQTVLASGFLPSALESRYAEVSEQLIERVRDEFAACDPVAMIRIHGDCHPGNILWHQSGPLFVDFDDCVSGPRIQDLWMFLSGSAADQQSAWMHLMAGYESFGNIDAIELRLVEPLRALRMLHYAAWLAGRWSDPAFPRAFPWFSEPRFWERHLNDLLEQQAVIDQPPLLAG
jgi:Ser/Thr protein kinase RdoA (MazF antagonist)